MLQPIQNIAFERFKARGAVSNPAGRFAAFERLPIADGWPGEGKQPKALPTEVRYEKTKRIVSENTSPDVPFNRSVNPYRGCEHGCTYCYARPSHSWIGLSPGLDFESKLVAKPDAPVRLRAAFEARGYKPEPIVLGTNTDAYQPIERQHEITRQLLLVCAEYKHPVTVLTKSSLILRDLDVLESLAKEHLVSVLISVTTLDQSLATRLEPRAASPKRRLSTLRILAAAGISTGVLISPIISSLNEHELEAIMTACRKVGARSASYAMLRLPHELKGIFANWLKMNYPDRASRVLSAIKRNRNGALSQSDFGGRMRGTGASADLLERRFEVMHRRLGFKRTHTGLNCRAFQVPPKAGQQMSLFA